MTALQPCANPKCLAPTAHDTDALRGPIAELLCLEHMAIALDLPCDALRSLAACIEPKCHHKSCDTKAKHVTVYGNYCDRHWLMRKKQK